MSRFDPTRHERSAKTSDGADVAALARSVGLRGFSPEPEAAEQPNPPTPHAPAKASVGVDVAALARSVGLRGFRRENAE